MSTAALLAVFGLILLAWGRAGKRVTSVVLIGSLLGMAIVPVPGNAQLGLPGGVADVLGAINGPVRLALDSIDAIVGSLRRLYQEIVWPVRLINRARATVASLIADFRALLGAVGSVDVRSATLGLPATLEDIIRNPGDGDFAALTESYYALYGSVPSSDEADELARNLIDVDDALALNTIKTLKVSDAVGELLVDSGDQIENAAESAAPGSAPFLTAAGLAANLQSQATMQKMLAAMIRQEAARIAHENALRKRDGIIINRARQNILNLLERTQP